MDLSCLTLTAPSHQNRFLAFFPRLSAKKSLPATCSSTADDDEESIDDLLASEKK